MVEPRDNSYGQWLDGFNIAIFAQFYYNHRFIGDGSYYSTGRARRTRQDRDSYESGPSSTLVAVIQRFTQ